jgi:hypothetical protein
MLSGCTEAGQKPPPPPSYSLPKVPWKGPAPWVEDLQKLLKNPKALAATSTSRDDDATIRVYDFAKFQANAHGILVRLDGKPKAWRWQFVAKGANPTDLVQPEHLERLVEVSGGETWYHVKAGSFENHYIAIKPRYLPPQALLTIETPEFASAENETGLQPWLCSNGRVPGTKPLNADSMINQCRALVRENLKAPSTADFQDKEGGVLYFGNCNQAWESSVEAQNAFGVPIRTRFKCTYDAATQELRVKLLP